MTEQNKEKKQPSAAQLKARADLKKLNEDRRKAKAAEAEKAEAATKAAETKAAAEAANKKKIEAAEAAEKKRLAEMKKGFDKDDKKKAAAPTINKAAALSDKGKEAIQEKAEVLKTKTFYKTAGHTWEISPNIQDLQYNGYPEIKEAITNELKAAGHWDNGKGKPNSFSEGKVEGYKENGEIKIIPLKFKGHDEIQYMIFLIPKKEMEIKVLQKVNYPWDSKTGRSQALQAGRDNREYTYEGITTIKLEAGQAIPLGSTTNGGKAINNYGSHWANLYKVHFPKSQYSDIKNYKELYEYDTNNLLDFENKVTIKGRNGGNILGEKTLPELLGVTNIINIGYLVG